MHAGNSSIQEAKTGGTLKEKGQHDYIVTSRPTRKTLYLKTKTNKRKQNNNNKKVRHSRAQNQQI